jgi:hypothetical protein
MAESRSAIGNKALETAVGSENGSATKSRRAESGAKGTSPSPAATSSACVGCGIGVDAVGWQSGEPVEAARPCATTPTPWSDPKTIARAANARIARTLGPVFIWIRDIVPPS